MQNGQYLSPSIFGNALVSWCEYYSKAYCVSGTRSHASILVRQLRGQSIEPDLGTTEPIVTAATRLSITNVTKEEVLYSLWMISTLDGIQGLVY